jgi:anhydro-N-acetylmuramic acid kinase
MIVAGVMSGTSADGINVALVRISRPKRSNAPSTIQLLGHAEYSYSTKIRTAVLGAMNAAQASVADLSRLNFLLGELYADSILATEKQFGAKANLVGCHGQTIYHQGDAETFLGRKVAATWQIGEGAIVAARVGAPVVSDFRPADLAANGKGAPLVPFLDHLLFHDPAVGRIVQNIGGIANLSLLPAGASARDVIAFDTGPGNMVIDAVVERLFGRPYDRGGRIAASGEVMEPVVEIILKRSFFRRSPPKTAGREEFGREFVSDFLRLCASAHKADIVATATALTARSIALAVSQCLARIGAAATPRLHEMILSGGGAKNTTLVSMLSRELLARGVKLRFSDDFGVPSDAKEAMAFAVLAHETWHRRPSNVPSATGAQRAAVLGKISYP